jgi:Domain of unknown function (DUF4956)
MTAAATAPTTPTPAWDSPFVRIVVYYALIFGAGWALTTLFPGIQPMFERFMALSPVHAISKHSALEETAGMAGPGSLGIAALTLVTLLSMIAAFVLMIPTAHVYRTTKQYGGYDQSVMQTVLVLPMLIAGTLILVQNSLALAFALGGVMAATRFRNTLKDVKDMVYILLALAVGLALGVFLPVIALVISLTFNVTILGLWYMNPGNIYDRRNAQDAVALAPQLKKKYTDVLLVRTARLKSARRLAEQLLDRHAKRWKLAEVVPAADGMSILEYLIRVKGNGGTQTLLEELRTRGGTDILTAELREARELATGAAAKAPAGGA